MHNTLFTIQRFACILDNIFSLYLGTFINYLCIYKIHNYIKYCIIIVVCQVIILIPVMGDACNSVGRLGINILIVI